MSISLSYKSVHNDVFPWMTLKEFIGSAVKAPPLGLDVDIIRWPTVSPFFSKKCLIRWMFVHVSTITNCSLKRAPRALKAPNTDNHKRVAN